MEKEVGDKEGMNFTSGKSSFEEKPEAETIRRENALVSELNLASLKFLCSALREVQNKLSADSKELDSRSENETSSEVEWNKVRVNLQYRAITQILSSLDRAIDERQRLDKPTFTTDEVSAFFLILAAIEVAVDESVLQLAPELEKKMLEERRRPFSSGGGGNW